MAKTFYAGNGRELVGFDTKNQRDQFVSCNPNYMAETSNDFNGGFRDYPQFARVRDHHGIIYNDDKERIAFVDDDFSVCYPFGW